MARQPQIQAALACAFLGLLVATPARANGLNDAVNKNNGCNAKFNATLASLYVSRNDSACANMLYVAFGETNQAKCPSTSKGSNVHLCMNKNGTAVYTDTWADLIRGCEYMYIANRLGSSESESGFTYNADSCFQRFNSWSDFLSWLYDASPYGGKAGDQGGAATIARAAFSVVLGTVLLALALVW